MNPTVLVLAGSVLADLRKSAFTPDERESCGFLVGRLYSGEVFADEAIFTENLSRLPDRFIISPIEHHRIKESLCGDRSIVAFFHTHRKQLRPSPLDAREMRFHPFVWLILARSKCGRAEQIAFAAYQSVGHVPIEVPIRVEA